MNQKTGRVRFKALESGLFYSCIIIFTCGMLLSACGPSAETKALAKQAKAIFGTIPEKMPGGEKDTAALIELGKKLYLDKALSVNNTQSCASCHQLENGGDDGLPVSPGALPGTKGGRNSPSVFNAGFHLAQFWDGRAADLKAQAKGPILNPVEMAMPDEATVIKKLAGIAEYPALFKKAFPGAKEPLTYDNLAGAIAAFERTLITRDRFDDFQNGNYGALNTQEQAGLGEFIKIGCTTCHSGAIMGGHMYQKMGLINAYENQKDQGRYEVTKNDADKMMFKVPSLRNIANTAPYFHDGSAKTLEEAVTKMAWLQLGKKLEADQVKKLTAFLRSLSNKK